MVVGCALLVMLLLLPAAESEQEGVPQLINALSQLTHQQHQDPASFDAWTAEVASRLGEKQLQRIAQNMDWLEKPKSQRELRQLQHFLMPSNSFKLQLWLSFYWQLRRAHSLDNMLLQHFALTLRQLRELGEATWSSQLQNVLQTLPRPLRVLLFSKQVCLQHSTQYVYVGAEKRLMGDAKNCSLWRVTDQLGTHWPWLGLENVCQAHSKLFVNMLLRRAQKYVLLSESTKNARCLCVQHDVENYYAPVADIHETPATCLWHVNDCSHLQEVLNLSKSES